MAKISEKEYYKLLQQRQPDLFKFVMDMKKAFPHLKIDKVFKNE